MPSLRTASPAPSFHATQPGNAPESPAAGRTGSTGSMPARPASPTANGTKAFHSQDDRRGRARVSIRGREAGEPSSSAARRRPPASAVAWTHFDLLPQDECEAAHSQISQLQGLEQASKRGFLHYGQKTALAAVKAKLVKTNEKCLALARNQEVDAGAEIESCRNFAAFLDMTVETIGAAQLSHVERAFRFDVRELGMLMNETDQRELARLLGKGEVLHERSMTGDLTEDERLDLVAVHTGLEALTKSCTERVLDLYGENGLKGEGDAPERADEFLEKLEVLERLTSVLQAAAPGSRQEDEHGAVPPPVYDRHTSPPVSPLQFVEEDYNMLLEKPKVDELKSLFATGNIHIDRASRARLTADEQEVLQETLGHLEAFRELLSIRASKGKTAAHPGGDDAFEKMVSRAIDRLEEMQAAIARMLALQVLGTDDAAASAEQTPVSTRPPSRA